MDNVFELVDVAVSRDNKNLLQDISWKATAGQNWIVLGSNGAGKSTLLQLIAAQILPSAGRVNILGEELVESSISDIASRVGISGASHNISMDMNVMDVVLTAAYGVNTRGAEEYDVSDEVRARNLLEAWGVLDIEGKLFGLLSEGEKKRVQISRALMTDPEILLLDEPTAGLDIKGREVLVRYLSILAADSDSPPAVLVTHHLEEIPANFTHVYLLDSGRCVAAGPIEDNLTSENLSKIFDMKVDVSRRGGRWFLQYV